MAASLRRSHNGNDLSLRRNFAYRPRRLFRRQGWLRVSARRVSAHQPWNYAAKRTTARLGWAGPISIRGEETPTGRRFSEQFCVPNSAACLSVLAVLRQRLSPPFGETISTRSSAYYIRKEDQTTGMVPTRRTHRKHTHSARLRNTALPMVQKKMRIF
ncbi:hypothetical protein C8035_v011098 [Colletotrichum spinosum]|uniref:Uncharacterized protein n=1 Tax=Colletotrichum spinosum TaxID=1347390 RepID=A0A4R8Q334_9PEZI|nr:hypothetical protein C8035_v011098 [Colletotrichum spinosum]